MKPRILFLVPEDFARLQRKGVEHMILERDEHGFFERVITAHPIAQRTQTIDFNGVHRLVEWDCGRSIAEDARIVERLAAPARFLRMLLQLHRLVRRERINLIRANDPYLMGLLALALSRRARIPFCVSIHADYDKNEVLRPKRGIARWLRDLSRWCPRAVFRTAGLVLPIRHHLAEWAVRQGARRERIHVIPHGVAPATLPSPVCQDIRGVLDIPCGVRVVSFVGRLSRSNYVFDALAIAERVLATDDVLFVMMGDGEERAAVEERVAASALLSRGVRIVGFRPHLEVVALRRLSDVSVCLMGGFSLLEACASGSPVVTYDVDWHDEVITDGVTGLLIPEGDVDGAAAAIRRLLDDRDLARRLAQGAQAFVAAHHDARHASDVKRACYSALLASTT